MPILSDENQRIASPRGLTIKSIQSRNEEPAMRYRPTFFLSWKSIPTREIIVGVIPNPSMWEAKPMAAVKTA